MQNTSPCKHRDKTTTHIIHWAMKYHIETRKKILANQNLDTGKWKLQPINVWLLQIEKVYQTTRENF